LFEALEKVAEIFHGVGEVDGGAPDGSDFVWFIGGGNGESGEIWGGRGGRDVEGVRVEMSGSDREGGMDVTASNWTPVVCE